MGIAFAAALTGIYILLIVQTGSFFMPLLIMMAIPLTLIGAMPGFWLLNLITGKTVGGFADPVFFTATGMIGMIALFLWDSHNVLGGHENFAADQRIVNSDI
jgi:multidrug efflux pump subunit AcrB